jgi:hypothetical protein
LPIKAKGEVREWGQSLTADIDVDGHVVRASRLELELLDGEVLVVLGVWSQPTSSSPQPFTHRKFRILWQWWEQTWCSQ